MSNHERLAGRTTMLLRTAAAGTALGTFGFLFVGDNWRSTNIFLVPDLLVCAALIAAAVLPPARMVAVLLGTFGAGIGVFGTATANYLVQGRFGIGAFIGLVTSAVASAFLVRILWSEVR